MNVSPILMILFHKMDGSIGAKCFVFTRWSLIVCLLSDVERVKYSGFLQLSVVWTMKQASKVAGRIPKQRAHTH